MTVDGRVCVLCGTGGGCLYVCLFLHICVEELVCVIEYFCVSDVFEGFEPLPHFGRQPLAWFVCAIIFSCVENYDLLSSSLGRLRCTNAA